MADETDFDDLILENFDAIIASFLKESDDYGVLVSHYAGLKYNKHLRWGRAEDLKEAIERARDALAATPENHPYQAAMLNNLGGMLESRYKRTGR